MVEEYSPYTINMLVGSDLEGHMLVEEAAGMEEGDMEVKKLDVVDTMDDIKYYQDPDNHPGLPEASSLLGPNRWLVMKHRTSLYQQIDRHGKNWNQL